MVKSTITYDNLSKKYQRKLDNDINLKQDNNILNIILDDTFNYKSKLKDIQSLTDTIDLIQDNNNLKLDNNNNLIQDNNNLKLDNNNNLTQYNNNLKLDNNNNLTQDNNNNLTQDNNNLIQDNNNNLKLDNNNNLIQDNNNNLKLDNNNNLIQDNNNLKYLYCYENNLKELNLNNNINLKKLNCSNNQLQKLNLNNNINLKLNNNNNLIQDNNKYDITYENLLKKYQKIKEQKNHINLKLEKKKEITQKLQKLFNKIYSRTITEEDYNKYINQILDNINLDDPYTNQIKKNYLKTIFTLGKEIIINELKHEISNIDIYVEYILLISLICDSKYIMNNLLSSFLNIFNNEDKKLFQKKYENYLKSEKYLFYKNFFNNMVIDN